MARGQATTKTGEALGRELRLLRIGRAMSQREAAERCGLSVGQWNRYESGRIVPYLVTMAQIADGLGLDNVSLGMLVRLAAKEND